MADRLLIILATADPRNAYALLPALSQATVAAAMEFKVEVVFTGFSGEVAKKGVAEGLFLSADKTKTIYDMICEAHEAGVKFKVCTSALEAWGNGLIDQVEETVGGAYLISEAMDEGTVVFTY